MKKIGIITFHRAKNYGAVLQAYALQHTLEQLGSNCEIVDLNVKISTMATNRFSLAKLILLSQF